MSDQFQAAVHAVSEYLRADPERCMPTCRVGCPCDGGMEDSATGAPSGPEEIVQLVLDKIQEWKPDGWWRVLGPDGDLWCESSDEEENREIMRPGDTLWHHEQTEPDQRWVKEES